MRKVQIGPIPAAVAGLAGQLTVLGVLAGSTGLHGPGWTVGIACGLTTVIALARGLIRSGAAGPGPADGVTLVRAALVGGVAAMVADSFTRAVPTPALVLLAVAALVLDAVDGRVARRTGTVSAVGARFDMEVDAFAILALSVYDVRFVGAPVLLIGAARYLFVAAGWWWPWLRQPAPPRYWCKVVAAIQGIALTLVASGALPRPAAVVVVLLALTLLTESFGRDVLWLGRHRRPGSGRAQPGGASGPVASRSRRQRWAAGVTTTGAILLVWFALLGPEQVDRLTPAQFTRIPIEGVALFGLVLLLPPRIGRAVATIVGVLLGLLTVVRILDMGFLAALDRPFDPVSDWSYLPPAVGVLTDSIGRFAGVAVVVLAAALVVAVCVFVPLAMRRLTGLVARRRRVSARVVTAGAALWVVAAAIGVQISGAPIASAGAAALAVEQVGQIRHSLQDEQTFSAAISSDPVAITPGGRLLTGLAGKDVIFAFVESYGQVAVQDSPFSPGVRAVLTAGSRSLQAAGFSSESAFLTSPTFGGISWLAHSTLQSGLWVDSQQRYDQLMASDRFTLSDAFRRAGWRTVGDVPSNDRDWPEGRTFYHYDQVYDVRNLGYRGPAFSYADMPDQYILARFRELELADPRHAPVMAEIDLVSSHTPWAPLPTTVDWNAIGDGSIFDGMPAKGQSPQAVWSRADQVGAAYGQSIRYSLTSLISFVQTYGDKNLVLVLLGDHQPATIVSGASAGHEVPITIIARDPAVTNRVAAWNWTPGLLPARNGPVWPMDAFRNRFLDAFD
ncbi:Phosphoglycerol transferase MdoB [Nakamurella panacisegetis]|uniref:Phosphoglycerol transferase MdoB n=1 Tax=Nakamurella panacisegetis TaxID=1090615 RepID=A0A1H0SVG0_9ACTN|nr:CDP-alcohol phosphatidyltransferase family protein [Nakamurella panacisegetis]SDP45701.1 Phosphoglycerol transferase MdoB [Nakamurella panacisegetis]